MDTGKARLLLRPRPCLLPKREDDPLGRTRPKGTCGLSYPSTSFPNLRITPLVPLSRDLFSRLRHPFMIDTQDHPSQDHEHPLSPELRPKGECLRWTCPGRYVRLACLYLVHQS